MSKSLYSTSEVARLFKVNRVTVYRWVKDGKVKAYEIGKHLKIPVSEVGRLLHDFGFSEQSVEDICGSDADNQVFKSVRSLAEERSGNKLIIVVDDDLAVLDVIERMFEEMELGGKYSLSTFSDSLEAALQIGKEKPDLIFLDMMMPGLNGVDLASKIKSIYEDVKIIFMTGYPENKKMYEDQQLDIYDYMGKPVDFNTLHSTIKTALQL